MTSHEYRLLAYLMHHTGRVISRTELVEHLYDQDFDRDSNTIEVFVGRIRKKLDVDIIQTVRGLGYLLTPPTASSLMRCMILPRKPVRGPHEFAAFRDHFDARQCSTLGDRLGRGDPVDHRHRAVVGVSQGHRACLRSSSQSLSAHADRRSRDPDDPQDKDKDLQSLGEPLFELPLSGWYWEIVRTDTEKTETRASRSLWDKKAAACSKTRASALTAAGIRQGYVDGPEGQNLRMVERPVDLGADGKFRVSVAGDATEIFEETRSFDYYLGGHVSGARPSCWC